MVNVDALFMSIDSSVYRSVSEHGPSKADSCGFAEVASS